jgi:hypothetical protein
VETYRTASPLPVVFRAAPRPLWMGPRARVTGTSPALAGHKPRGRRPRASAAAALGQARGAIPVLGGAAPADLSLGGGRRLAWRPFGRVQGRAYHDDIMRYRQRCRVRSHPCKAGRRGYSGGLNGEVRDGNRRAPRREAPAARPRGWQQHGRQADGTGRAGAPSCAKGGVEGLVGPAGQALGRDHVGPCARVPGAVAQGWRLAWAGYPKGPWQGWGARQQGAASKR